MSNETLDALEARKLTLEIEQMERGAEKVLKSAIENGRFQFIGEVHEASVHNTMNRIEEYLSRHPQGDVEIILNSAGGSVIDGFALVDFLKLIRSRGTKVTIIGMGLVASMASGLMQAADDRVLTSRAWMGIHEVSSGAQGTVSAQEDSVAFTKRLQEQMIELLCERSDLTATKLRNRWKRKDIYFNSAEALKNGLIDRIEAT